MRSFPDSIVMISYGKYLQSLGNPAFVSLLFIFVMGCDSRKMRDSPVADGSTSSIHQVNSTARQKQADFLNSIRKADPGGQTIDRAMINPQNELGLILDRSVELDKIPALMKTILTKMAAEFPGEDLTVLAYTPSNPPHKIGTGRLNSRTRDMIYTPE